MTRILLVFVLKSLLELGRLSENNNHNATSNMLNEPFASLFVDNVVRKADISLGISAADCNKTFYLSGLFNGRRKFFIF